MSKTKILYKDVAPGADRDAKLTSLEHSDDSNLDLLPFGVEPRPVATLERNRWLLNGTFQLRETQKLAFWSSVLSDTEGSFGEYPPSITVTFSQQYSSTGITVMFDRATGEYCSAINIKWFQGETLKADVDFTPDSTEYFCEQKVTSYDKLVLTFLKTAVPCRYAKVDHIVFGVWRTFGMSELRSASVINEIDGIAETLPISTFKWTLDSRKNVDFMFQLKQPVEIYNDANLLGVYYIDNHSRKTARIYNIDCYDAIGVMDESPFPGGVYSEKSAKDLLAEIVGTDFDIIYADDVDDMPLTGILRSGTRRSAIQQIAFAWGVCVATDGGAEVRVFNLDTVLREIGKEQTFSGVSIETASIVTEVCVTAHTYTEDASGDVDIGGVKYADTKTVYKVSNPDVTANDKQNVKEFRDATLVSPSNAQQTAQRIYDWYLLRNTAKANIVWKGESLGDFVSIPNTWGSANKGNITKMEIRLSNTVIAKCEAVG